MDWGATLVIGIVGIVLVSALIGLFFGGFAIAGRSREKGHFILRGILWSLLIILCVLFGLFALAFCGELIVSVFFEH